VEPVERLSALDRCDGLQHETLVQTSLELARV
jgi:hypothetical protein